jgi:hypothetical protein
LVCAVIVFLGLVILVAAVVVGVLATDGHAHAVTHFAVFGYHVTGSTGTRDRHLTGSGAGPAREPATACASRSRFAKEVTS